MNYKYSPLSAASRGTFSIRLLHLLPTCNSQPDGSLSCRLVETKIVDRSLDTSALSYTWGLPIFSHSLKILDNNDDNGILTSQLSSSREIRITENLYAALRCLRKQTETLVLWVDAVCIDQNNIVERNSQVANFPKTYAEATSVLVWLGPDDVLSHGRLCLDFFTELAAIILEDPNSESENDQRSWRKRFRINQRSWFKRRWIIQEVVLANDVWVHYGATNIHWNAFELALVELFENDKGGFSDDHRTILRTMSRIRNADAMLKRQTPLDTLVEFDSFECSNPRDRLYALYGVMQHWFPNSAGMQVLVENINYGLPIRDIFTDFAILMMKLRDDFPLDSNYNSTTHVLQLAAAMRPTLQRGVASQDTGIPSWVPDWTGIMRHKPLHHSPESSDASRGIPKQHFQIMNLKNNSRALVAVGLVHDVIKAVIPLDILPLTGAVHKAKHALNNFLCSIATSFDEIGFFSSGNTDIYSPTGQHIISAIAVSLVANWEHTPANSYFAQDARFPAQFLEQLRSSRHHLPEILHKWPAYVELVAITMRGRSLVLTGSGYVGICDTNVRAGDVVAAKSCSSLTNGEIPTEEAFELLGDAYIHALMNGEAAEGLGKRLETSLRRLYIL
ncbi:heterokaryon incompatibility protein (HET) domain-containing protein [Trichoderma breve]|uniref:Heterokaryon incompatibility protein (HET) domain-containing protein n=1 Tax=Trichoderma breve TaxID=2034170 RepID=A0A9W9BE02_9HYPO|nr:heterokaryon incompatibility protein (HET) domain-containing protein [Trichoderma breve]KAJ4858106.1 heterokaryon incompatibility protein (HET) domain-containing protein [Trichoderma breve]